MPQKNNVVAMPTLADHLEDCAERYTQVVNRLDAVDGRLDRMENLLVEIKNRLGATRPTIKNKLLPR